MRCAETAYLVSQQSISVPRRPHCHYKGSNFSDQIGPVLVESWDVDSCWKMSRKEKKAVMGRFQIEAGGPVDPGLCDTSKWKNRETEPTFFHAKPCTLCDELAHSYFARSIVDFTPASGNWALVALRRRLPYCGVTCSETHSQALFEHLSGVVAAALVKPEDSLYRRDLVADDAAGGGAPTVGGGAPTGGGGAPSTANGKSKAGKAKPAKPQQQTVGKTSSSSGQADKEALMGKLQALMAKKPGKKPAVVVEDDEPEDEAQDSGVDEETT